MSSTPTLAQRKASEAKSDGSIESSTSERCAECGAPITVTETRSYGHLADCSEFHNRVHQYRPHTTESVFLSIDESRAIQEAVNEGRSFRQVARDLGHWEGTVARHARGESAYGILVDAERTGTYRVSCADCDLDRVIGESGEQGDTLARAHKERGLHAHHWYEHTVTIERMEDES